MPMDSRNFPCFVVGFARSGTTLLSLMLDGGSRLAIPYESHFIPEYFQKRTSFTNLAGDLRQRKQLVREIISEPYVAKWDSVPSLDEIDLDRCRTLAGAINEVFLGYARKHGKARWGDKTPAYLPHIDVLNTLFPEARFVHIVRDGRDVALSVAQQSWGPNNFFDAISRWNKHVYSARKMLSMLPSERWLEVRFEDLVANPDSVLEQVCRTLRTPFEQEMLTTYRSVSAGKVGDRIFAHHQNLTRPPSLDQCFKWKLTLDGAGQSLAHEIAGDLLADLGYEQGVSSHPLRLAREILDRVRAAAGWRFSKRSGTGWKR